jgi:flagellar M-ring protein FliF
VKEFWNRLDRAARFGLMVGAFAILLLTAGLVWWALHQEDGVLFSGLSAQDASAMVGALDRMKQPYRLEQGGSTILVPAENVHKIRLQLMGQDIPLHGTVGFELFNNSDFSMTEFAQKVNYQRALQGEITRTILSVDDIQAARVHLAMSEQGLFKRKDAQSKASVTLTLKPGHQLGTEQVKGIQRLVAASVADIEPADVTIVDQHGVALTHGRKDLAGETMSADVVEAKRNLEGYLRQKLDAVLDKTFGAGRAIASVDVQLNDKTSKQVIDDVLPADKERGTGVVLRERQSTRPKAGQVDTDEVTQSEYDYQVGRKTEQIERGPGGVERISVAVVVDKPLSEAEAAQFKSVVANTVGLVEDRGDRVALYTMNPLEQASQPQAVPPAAGEVPSDVVPAGTPPTAQRPWSVVAALGAIAGIIMLALLWQSTRRNPSVAAGLSEAEREHLLGKVNAWLAAEREEDKA